MINRKLLSILALSSLFGSCLDLRAQEEAPISPPTPPFVTDPTPGTQCNITVEYDKAPSDPGTTSARVAPKVKQLAGIHVSYGADATQIVAHWSDGSEIVGYLIKGRLFEKLSSGRVSVQPPQDDNFFPSIFVTGYPGTSWLSLAGYKGLDRTDHGKAYKFYQPSKIVEIAGVAIYIPDLTAWIYVVNKIPAKVKMGNVTYTYSAIQASNQQIDLPDDVQKALKETELEQKSLDSMRRLNQSP